MELEFLSGKNSKWNTKAKAKKKVCKAVRLREPRKGLMWGILPSQEL